jgi:hypothetical protein
MSMMGFVRIARYWAVALAAMLAVVTAAAQPAARFPDVPRIVAVADVHGAFEELVELLQATGVIDAALAWSGDDAHLVSLGDLLDRGPRSREVMDLLMRLQSEAAAHGGAVHVVLGNHEVMNLVGDLRYVSVEEYAAFADDERTDVRSGAFERFVADAAGAMTADEALGQFEQHFPPGYFAHRAAFRADGTYGSWLLSLPAIVVIGDTVFVHGGLPEMVARIPADEINAEVGAVLRRYLELRDQLAEAGVLPPYAMEQDLDQAEAALRTGRGEQSDVRLTGALEEFLELAAPPVLGVAGPLWYRGAIYCNPSIEGPVLNAALDRLDAARVVVGHTVTNDRRVRVLYDGQLIMLDTGMQTGYYMGRPAALVIEGSRSHVQYTTPPGQEPAQPGRIEAFGLSASQLLHVLGSGTIESAAGGAGPGGAAPVRVRFDEAVIEAWLYPPGAADAGALELAAYTLDRMVGFHLVPPTVAREIDGVPHTLQLRFTDAVSDTERVERRMAAGIWCGIDAQAQLMNAFDLLTYNTGRSTDNVLFRYDASALQVIDHHRAFGTERRIAYAPGALRLPAAVVDALAMLDEPTLAAELDPSLSRRQIRALLARRDQVLALAAND